MKTKRKSRGVFGAVVAAICIIIYAFALIQAAVRIYLSIEERRITAANEFSNIAYTALNAGTQGFMTEQFIETMNRALQNNNSIEALIISGPEGEYPFERQQGYAITWANNSPRFINRFSFSNENYYRPLAIPDQRNATIRAVAGAFNFNEITNILKETLILILGGFAVSFFTMLLQMLIGGKPVQEPAAVTRTFEPAPVKPDIREQFTERETPKKTEQKQFIKNEPREEYNLNQYEQNKYEPNQYTPKQFDQDQFNIIDGPGMPAEAPSYPNYAIQDEPVTPDVTIKYEQEEQGPKGLYSPRSNIGWEEYTKDRLDSEIHRCSSTEKDLTVVLMEFTNITNALMYKLAAEEAISFFASRDLLFEYGEHGILVILTGIELDSGISKSEKFYQRITEKSPNNNNSHLSLNIGLSSRAGRLVNAERLMMEAQEALTKAKHDKNTSIIAFKSDPEKYRAFIASQNSQRP